MKPKEKPNLPGQDQLNRAIQGVFSRPEIKGLTGVPLDQALLVQMLAEDGLGYLHYLACLRDLLAEGIRPTLGKKIAEDITRLLKRYDQMVGVATSELTLSSFLALMCEAGKRGVPSLADCAEEAPNGPE